MDFLSRVRTRTLIFILIPLAAIILGGIAIFSKPEAAPSPVPETPADETITSSITAIGTVVAAERADLAFDRSGTIASLPFAVGTHVARGTVLASLDARIASSGILESESAVASARAELEKASVSLKNAASDADGAVNAAYASATDAVRAKLDSLFTDDDRNPRLTFQTYDSQVENDLYTQRLAATGVLASWALKLTQADTEDALERSVRIRMLLYRAQDALRMQTSLDAATLKEYQGDVAEALNSINAAIESLELVAKTIRTAKSEITIREASVARAEASVEKARAEMLEYSIVAPFSGVIADSLKKRGEFAFAGSTIISLASDALFEIEADIPEAYIGKIRAGMPVSVTLDAYPDTAIPGTIAQIEPAGRTVNDVVYYRVKVAMGAGAARKAALKSGLTANISITP